MKETFIQQSGILSDLREVNIADCDGMYSATFINRVVGKNKAKAKSLVYRDGKPYKLGIPEFIEVKQTDSGTIIWNAINHHPKKESEFDFHSSFGVFHSSDRGEFGGTLTTPNEVLYGNFCKIWEQSGKVYAIDSLFHGGVRHFRLLEFSKDSKSRELISQKDNEWFSFTSLTTEADRTIILINGLVFDSAFTIQTAKQVSSLLEVTENGCHTIAEFKFWIEPVYNMLLTGNKLILGMDKIIAVINLDAKKITAYTPLTTEAETDLKNNR